MENTEAVNGHPDYLTPEGRERIEREHYLVSRIETLWNALNVLANGFTEQQLIDRIGKELTDEMFK
jgi:SLT domain-containing protein